MGAGEETVAVVRENETERRIGKRREEECADA
jgi:hypothetical protein